MNPKDWAQRLLKWYDGCRRDLPWRLNSDPYRIWVSEIMLQQTRVETVIPYYNQFMERFPDAASLAEASEAEVLSFWQGLGYYSRVRNLQAGVREVVERFGGKVPADLQSIRALPGIGEYTAGAILSMAYGKAEPAIDGNVLRVMSRFLMIEEPVDQGKTKQEMAKTVCEFLPADRPGDFNQALMELGALICIPKSPRCDNCPWQSGCLAFIFGQTDNLPKKRTKTASKPIWVLVGMIELEGRALVRLRPEKGLLAGMWEFPSVESDQPSSKEALIRHFQDMGISVGVEGEPRELRHIFSHRDWHMTIYRCISQEKPPRELPRGNCWLAREQWESVNWAGPHRTLAKWLSQS